jgi:outer membrane lipoprotein SlyB
MLGVRLGTDFTARRFLRGWPWLNSGTSRYEKDHVISDDYQPGSGGAIAGGVVAGPVGAAVGAGTGAVVSKAAGDK